MDYWANGGKFLWNTVKLKWQQIKSVLLQNQFKM